MRVYKVCSIKSAELNTEQDRYLTVMVYDMRFPRKENASVNPYLSSWALSYLSSHRADFFYLSQCFLKYDMHINYVMHAYNLGGCAL